MSSSPLSLSTRWQTLVPQRPVSAERIQAALLQTMFAPQHNKQTLDGQLVPNRYCVQIHLAAYHRLAVSDLQQRLPQALQHAITKKNRRLGRQLYQMQGDPQVELLPNTALALNEIRVQPQFDTVNGVQRLAASTRTLAYLVSQTQRWQLEPTITAIGRAATCTIQLRDRLVQTHRLVSSQHAQIDYANSRFQLWDGKPPYLPSKNGTFLNGQMIPLREPIPLEDGAEIVLASLDPLRPNRQTLGVAVLNFYCSEAA